MANVTIPERTLTTDIDSIAFDENGDIRLTFRLLESGSVRAVKQFILRANGTGVYDLADGTQIAATTPAQFLSDASSLKTRADAALASAAGAGKIRL